MNSKELEIIKEVLWNGLFLITFPLMLLLFFVVIFFSFPFWLLNSKSFYETQPFKGFITLGDYLYGVEE
jgi:hypothetical protein